MKTLFYIICAILVFLGMVIFTIRDFVSARTSIRGNEYDSNVPVLHRLHPETGIL